MYRIERDSMGEIKVPEVALWGAQTQRSLENFHIGSEKMPLSVIEALIYIKKACAKVNELEGKLSNEKAQAIQNVADQLLADLPNYADQFPLSLWQTGSGTQTNMNVNEVIAHIASTDEEPIHPNDHVNLSQSSNDVFPTAMHISAYQAVEKDLLPELTAWINELNDLENRYLKTVKIGRTHLQDATPLTFGQEVSGWKSMIEHSLAAIQTSLASISPLAIGGTAVGTGINASVDFGDSVSHELANLTGLPLTSEANKFFALTSHQPLSYVHGAMRALAGDVMKIEIGRASCRERV